MSDRSYAHESVAWAKQRLDDLDTIISEAEKTTAGLKESARKEADQALARLQESRVKLQSYYDKLRAKADAAQGDVEQVLQAFEAQWVEVESEFQSFVAATREQADAARKVVAARAQAQRRAWEESLKNLRDQANETVEKARAEFDAAIKRLSDETEKFQSRITEVKDAGDESWKAVKGGLADAKAVHERTIQKIKDAFSKLF